MTTFVQKFEAARPVSQTVRSATAVVASDTDTFSPPALGIAVQASAAGNVVLEYADGSTLTIPVPTGYSELRHSPVKLKQTGTVAGTFKLLN